MFSKPHFVYLFPSVRTVHALHRFVFVVAGLDGKAKLANGQHSPFITSALAKQLTFVVEYVLEQDQIQFHLDKSTLEAFHSAHRFDIGLSNAFTHKAVQHEDGKFNKAVHFTVERFQLHVQL
ncbi:hypothetical protein HOF65_03115 [bacterium]|nr:hypothetical protein [bacterium]MBT3852983.1 hypothetical protein [bacterium]MBT5492058.1 hypothetical protein [bacterium]MBT6778809.1 hypothetical protein [bacterium]